jgi:CBS domain-containing protein
MRTRARRTSLCDMDTSAARRTVLAADVMQPVPTTVEPEAHLAAAAYLMRQAAASALVVLRDERTRTPVGIVTDTDVAHAVADGRRRRADAGPGRPAGRAHHRAARTSRSPRRP